MAPKRIVFMGEKPLGLQCLKLLEADPEAELVGVCTRGRQEVWWGRQELRDHCEERRIPIITRSQILEQEVDHLISVLYPFVIEEKYINHCRLGSFNLHEAPLPRWKGKYGYSHAILSGDEEYATTLHEMTPKLDDGRTIAKRTFPIAPFETARELYQRTSAESCNLAKEWFPRLLADEYSPQGSASSAESFLNRNDSLVESKQISIDTPIDDVFRVVRALDFVPWEPTFVCIGEEKFYLFLLDALGREDATLENLTELTTPGTLASLPWGSFDTGVLKELPRPMAVCQAGSYIKHFPIFGGVAGADDGR